MKKNIDNITLNNNLNAQKDTEIIQLKEYKKPELKSYGDISELVLTNAGSGGDGGAMFVNFS